MRYGGDDGRFPKVQEAAKQMFERNCYSMFRYNKKADADTACDKFG